MERSGNRTGGKGRKGEPDHKWRSMQLPLLEFVDSHDRAITLNMMSLVFGHR